MTLPAALTAQSDANKKQEPPQPDYVIRATTRLVILDIVAVDAKGNTVTDLKPEEIQILENGKEQIKRDFTFLHPDAEHAPQRVVLHLPPDVYTNVPQYKGNSSFNIILFDVLNTHFENIGYAQDKIVSYLDKHPPTEPTALYALGNKLWLLHDFTTDAHALRESIAKFKGQGAKLVNASPDEGKTYTRKSTFMTISGDRQGATLDAFRSLARIMSAYPGRKNLIWVSESFVVDTMSAVGADHGPQFLAPALRYMEETSDAMMEAQIAIYPIDAGGLSADISRPMLNNFESHNSMKEMADRTGGKAFINRNDLDLGIQSSIDDGSSYYTTSYQPQNKTWDGKLRNIELKCSRPGVKLRYRKGYYAVNTASHPPSKQEIKDTSMDFANSLDPALPVSTAILFQAQIVPPSEKTANKSVINFNIDPRMVSFERKDDGLEHAEVSCIAWAYPVKGKPVGSGGGTVKAALDEPTFKKVMQAALPCRQTIELPAGNYMLRLGVIDQSTKHMGALTAWLTVPEQTPPAGAPNVAPKPAETTQQQ